eukprot:4007828-Pleurochrysis_carterae.AAC.1
MNISRAPTGKTSNTRLESPYNRAACSSGILRFVLITPLCSSTALASSKATQKSSRPVPKSSEAPLRANTAAAEAPLGAKSGGDVPTLVLPRGDSRIASRCSESDTAEWSLCTTSSHAP